MRLHYCLKFWPMSVSWGFRNRQCLEFIQAWAAWNMVGWHSDWASWYRRLVISHLVISVTLGLGIVRFTFLELLRRSKTSFFLLSYSSLAWYWDSCRASLIVLTNSNRILVVGIIWLLSLKVVSCACLHWHGFVFRGCPVAKSCVVLVRQTIDNVILARVPFLLTDFR